MTRILSSRIAALLLVALQLTALLGCSPRDREQGDSPRYAVQTEGGAPLPQGL